MTIDWNFSALILALFCAHALCDYPLQGDFLARGKSPEAPITGVPWYQCLIAHCLIHAGAVALITGSAPLGFIELGVHWWADVSKCEGRIAFNQDQIIHYGVKVLYAVLVVTGWAH